MKSISRRSLIKGTCAGAAAVALGGAFYPRRASGALVGNVPAWKMIYCWNNPFGALDPHVDATIPPFSYRLNLYGELYRNQDSPAKLVPWIAESYKASPDARQWTFRLKKGLKFHDGEEITAEDVRFSLERVLEIKKEFAPAFSSYMKKDDVKVIDRYTCQFNLNQPVGFFISVVPQLSIVNSKLLRKHDKNGDYGSAWLADNDAGSGAYKLKSWDPAKGFTAEQFPAWPGGWAGKHFKEIEFTNIVEVASRVAALKKGLVHALNIYLGADQVEELKKGPTTKVISEVSLRPFLIRLNYIRPPTSNIHFRKALSYAFPYDAFIEKAMLNNAVRAQGGPVPNKMWGWPKDLKIYETDMAKAKEELGLARKELPPEQFDRPVTIKTITGQTSTKIAALYLQSAASELGLTMNIKEEPFNILNSEVGDPKTTHDISIQWMSPRYLDPDAWLGRYYSKASHGAVSGATYYYNPKVEELLEKGRSISGQEKRRPLYEEATRIIVAEAADIWLSNEKMNGIFTADVQGWRFCDVGAGQELYPMWRE